MATFKKFALVGILALSAAFTSTAHADTVGCHKYNTHQSHSSNHWEKVVVDLTKWTATHQRHHPYYNTMHGKLVHAKYNLKLSKQSGHHKHHYKCKVDVSPS